MPGYVNFVQQPNVGNGFEEAFKRGYGFMDTVYQQQRQNQLRSKLAELYISNPNLSPIERMKKTVPLVAMYGDINKATELDKAIQTAESNENYRKLLLQQREEDREIRYLIHKEDLTKPKTSKDKPLNMSTYMTERNKILSNQNLTPQQKRDTLNVLEEKYYKAGIIDPTKTADGKPRESFLSPKKEETTTKQPVASTSQTKNTASLDFQAIRTRAAKIKTDNK